MNELKIMNQQGVLMVDSRDVAEMIGKQHKNLLCDIDGYIEVLGQSSRLSSADFFQNSTYKAGAGKNYKCYLLTRKGCDMVANKLIGKKGVLFTAEYVSRFEEMEQKLKGANGISEIRSEALYLAAKMAEGKERLELENAKQTGVIEEMKPKADYYDTILQSKSLMTATSIAKDYGMSARKFNAMLHDLGIQYKLGGV